jgi:hypothetical protein
MFEGELLKEFIEELIEDERQKTLASFLEEKL